MLKYEEIIKATLKDNKLQAPQYLGYYYLIYCINYIMEQRDICCCDKPSITVAYSECAKVFSNPEKTYTSHSIERAIRTYKKYTISHNCEKLYNRDVNQTNTAFIYNIIELIEKYGKETDSVFEKFTRVDKDDDLYFLLTNGNGYATSYDIEKAAKIMGKEINPNDEKDLIRFTANAHGVSSIIKSSDMTPEDFLKYGQKYLAIRFCTKEFGISIVEAKNLIESVLED